MSERQTTPDAKTEIFLDGLIKIVSDIDKGGRKDPDMVLRVGSLADQLIKSAGKPNWSAFKAGLSATERNNMIATFSREIEDSGEKGNIRMAYAMQAVAASIVGDGFDDERITPGIALLDRYIVASRDFFIRNAPKPN